MLKKFCLLIIFVIGITLSSPAQNGKTSASPPRTPTPTIPPPGNIQLLPGYTHTRGRGIDSRVGVISKPDGLTIRYDIGRMAGQYTSKCALARDACLWNKSQKIGGRDFYLSLTKEGEIIATFPQESANFFAQTKSPEDIADFLIMVLTYKIQEDPGLQTKNQVQVLKQE